MAMMTLSEPWRSMTCKALRGAIAIRAEQEGWQAFEQVDLDGQPLDFILFRGVTVLMRISTVPISDDVATEFEQVAARVSALGLLVDMAASKEQTSKTGRVSTVQSCALMRFLGGEVSLSGLLQG